MSKKPTKADLEQKIQELEQENRSVREAARQTEERYQSLFAHSVEMFYVHDFEGRFLDANDKALEMLGYTRDEIPQHNLASIIFPEDLPAAVRLFNEMKTAGFQKEPSEYRLRRKDGSVVWVEASSSVIYRNGMAYAVQGIARDITSRKLADEKLRLSEEKQRKILESIEEAYYEFDLKGNLTYCNSVAYTMLGYEPQEMTGVNFRKFTTPETTALMLEIFRRIYETGNPERLVDYEVICKDGSLRNHELSAGLTRDEAGRPCGFHVLVHDITPRKQAEERLKESEEHYRSILESMEEAYYEVDLGGNLTFFNPRAGQSLGLSDDVLKGLNFRKYMDEANAKKVFNAYHQVFLTGEPITGVDWELFDKDGHKITVEASVSLRKDAQGTPMGFRGVVRDVTQRKKAEDALRASEEKYRGILESMQESYFEVDLGGNFTFFNEAAMTMSGYSREELQGMNYRQYAPPDTEQRMFETFHQVYVTGMPQQLVGYQVIHKNGSLRDNELSVWPMKDASGNTVGFHALVRDVTSRKSAEKALRENEERYRAIFENTGNASILIAKDTTILLANSNFAKLTGYSKEEMEGKMSWTTFVEAADLERMKQYHERRRVDSSLAPQSYEFRLKASSGELRDMFLTIVMIPGTMESVASCMDITDRRRAEEELKEREAKYRFLTEKMNDVVWTMGLDLRTTYVSPSITRVLGFTPEERMAQDPRDQLTPDSFSEALRILSYELERDSQPGVDPERTIIFEGEYCHKDGSRVWLENNITGIRNEQGNIVGLHGLSRDVTERKKTARALKESEEKYRTILESMEEAYLEVDLAGAFTFFNDSFLRIIGYSREEISGMNYKDISRPETVAGLYRLFNEIYRTGNKRTLINHEIIRKDGSPGIVEMSISLMRGPSGEPVGFGGVGRDVTARILAERALKESERKYRLLAENLRDVIWVLDADLKYIYVSPSVMRLRGYTPEEAMAQTMKEVLAPESYQRAVELFTEGKLLENSGQKHGMEWTHNIDLEMIRKDGSTVWTEVTLNILYDENGAPAGLLGITHDISERRKAAEALRESEERWLFALEGAGDGVWDYDVENNRVFRSRRWKEMLGYSEDDISEGTEVWAGLVHPDDRQSSDACLNRHLRGETPVYVSEYRIRCKDGSYKWILDRGKVLRFSEDGRPLRIIGTQSDITERRQAEEALKKSEEFYRTIFENTGNASMLLDKDTTVLLVNSNFEKLSGYKRHEVENKMSWTVFVSPEDLAKMKRYHELRRKEGGGAPDSYEFTFVDRQGQTRDVFLSIALIPGTMISVASLMDISERKKGEKALRESEERFRDLARLLPETVFETDEQGRFTFVNQSSLERFGYTQEEVDSGLSLLDVVAPEDHERAIMNYSRIMNGEMIGLNEYYAKRRDGTVFPALVHTTVIYHDGKPAGLRGFLIDVTEKKNLEDQLLRSQKLEAVGTLAGGIAHDFNNLLMGILGNVSLMLMHFDETHPFYDRLKSMEEYVQRGSDLTKQLLGFARGGKYEVKPTNLGDFVRKSSDMFGRTKKEIRIHHKISDDLWSVDVDRGQMEQVMLNLFVNAWQAMPGGGDLYISVENKTPDESEVSPLGILPGRFVKVTITDTGIGMDDAVKERIFEPFFTTKERGRGTGLGLASVYGIIKNHGGFIQVESEKDLGTSFMIYIPATDKEVPEEQKKNGEIRKGQEKVLLIDDEEMILEVGSSMLKGLGYEVITAPGGRQGLKLYEEVKDEVELVILDMIMPDFGGKETFETLRRVNPDVKVLLSSGYSLDGQAKDIMKSGCRGFIQKPFSMADLSKKIREILDDK